MRRRSVHLATTALALFMASASGAAAAQEADATADAGLTDIIVTAEKRPSSEQRTPIAITVLTPQSLASAGVTDVNGLANIAPTLNIAQNNANTLITIRGVSSRDYAETGDPAVAVSIDNFYLQRAVGLNAAMFDVERVEVLRGPQGTLYGRNATGGAINISTAKPKDRFELLGSAEVGNYGTINTEAAINVPVTDTLAIRAAGAVRTHEGYRDNVNVPRGDDQDDAGARLHVQWKPTSAFTALVTGEYVKSGGVGAVLKNIPYSNVNTDGTLDFGSRKRWALNNPGYTDIEIKNTRVALSYDFGLFTASYMGGLQNMKFNRDNDQDGGIAATFGFQQNEDVDTQNHELRFVTNGDGPFNLQLGAYYFREKDDLLTFFQVHGGGTPFNFYTFDYATKSKSKALFAQGKYALTDQLSVEAGVRYTKDEKSQIGTSDTTGGAFVENVDRRYSGDKVTWHAGVNWQATPRNLIYAKVDRGYKAGGYTNTAIYDPETITAYEIGSKNRFLDNRLQVNLTAFYYDYKDMQIQQNDPVTALNFVRNADSAELYGAEFDMVYQATPETILNANVAYLHTKFGAFCTVAISPCPAANDISGKRLPQSPEWSIGGGITHDFIFGESKLTARVQSRYQSKSYFTFFNRASEQQKSYTRTDATLTYSRENWPVTIGVYGRNLENSRILTASEEAGYAGGYLVQFAAPRTYGVRLTYAF